MRIIGLILLLTTVITIKTYGQNLSYSDNKYLVPDNSSTPIKYSSNPDTVLKQIIWEPFNAQTIVWQSISGLGSGALILLPRAKQTTSGLGEGLTIIAQTAAAIVVVPLVIYFTGELSGGDGSYLLTLAGALVGGGIALIPNISRGTGDIETSKITSLILSVVGSVLGYHLFANAVYDSSKNISQSLQHILDYEQVWNSTHPANNKNYFQFAVLNIQF